MPGRPPASTLFPYPTLFRSELQPEHQRGGYIDTRQHLRVLRWRDANRVTHRDPADRLVADREPDERYGRQSLHWDGDTERAGSRRWCASHAFEQQPGGGGACQRNGFARRDQCELQPEHQRSGYIDTRQHLRVLRWRDANRVTHRDPPNRLLAGPEPHERYGRQSLHWDGDTERAGSRRWCASHAFEQQPGGGGACQRNGFARRDQCELQPLHYRGGYIDTRQHLLVL